MLGVAWREPVFVDQHGLMRQPRLPCRLADMVEDALAKLARPGDKIQAFGLGLGVVTENSARHGLLLAV